MRIISPKRLLESVAPTVRNGSIFNASSLDLQFARTKTLDPRITFTRASSGTYVGSDGLIKTATTNEARFDHNPSTLESLGLLVEEQRTNLFQYSEEFDNAYWAKTNASGTITANQIISPNDLTTADLYQEDTATSGRYLGKSISFTSGTIYTVSCWAKQAPGATRYLGFIFPTGSFGVNVSAIFTLSGAGVATIGTSGTNTSASIQAFANGWYRCSLTSQATVTSTSSIQFRLTNLSGSAASSYLGDGASGIYLWGAQVEAGSFPTSYIPTTTATVTRSADVASITGTNFSSWYNQSQGTVFTEYRTPASGTRGVAGFNDNTANERIALFTNGTDPKLLVVDGGVTQVDINGGTISAGVITKSAATYALNDFAFVHAAGTAVTDTSGTIPTVDRLLIGADQAGNYQNGRIKRLTYWPSRLPNATLQQITR